MFSIPGPVVTKPPRLLLFANTIFRAGTDFYVWLKIALDLQSVEQSQGIYRMDNSQFSFRVDLFNISFFSSSIFHQGRGLKSIRMYYTIPFYAMYTSFVPIHGKLTTTIYRIGIRYRKLNDIICTYIEAGRSAIRPISTTKLKRSSFSN